MHYPSEIPEDISSDPTEAWKEGYSAGYDDGEDSPLDRSEVDYKQGHEEGYDEGYEDGKQSAYTRRNLLPAEIVKYQALYGYACSAGANNPGSFVSLPVGDLVRLLEVLLVFTDKLDDAPSPPQFNVQIKFEYSGSMIHVKPSGTEVGPL